MKWFIIGVTLAIALTNVAVTEGAVLLGSGTYDKGSFFVGGVSPDDANYWGSQELAVELNQLASASVSSSALLAHPVVSGLSAPTTFTLSAGDAGFDTAVGLLTNGAAGEYDGSGNGDVFSFRLRGTGGSAGSGAGADIAERDFFTADPYQNGDYIGTNGLDFEGFLIDEIITVFDDFALDYDGEGGTLGSYAVTIKVFGSPAVPEPSSVAVWSILCLAGVGLSWRRKRR